MKVRRALAAPGSDGDARRRRQAQYGMVNPPGPSHSVVPTQKALHMGFHARSGPTNRRGPLRTAWQRSWLSASLSPDYEALLRLLTDHFGEREFSIEEAEDFTLFETPFLHDAHLKQKTLAPAERSGQLKPVKAKADRRKSSFPPETTMHFVSGRNSRGTNGA